MLGKTGRLILVALVWCVFFFPKLLRIPYQPCKLMKSCNIPYILPPSSVFLIVDARLDSDDGLGDAGSASPSMHKSVSKGFTVIRAATHAGEQRKMLDEWLHKKAQRKEERGNVEDEQLPVGVPVKKKERTVIVVGDSYQPGAMLGSVIDRCDMRLAFLFSCSAPLSDLSHN